MRNISRSQNNFSHELAVCVIVNTISKVVILVEYIKICIGNIEVPLKVKLNVQ